MYGIEYEWILLFERKAKIFISTTAAGFQYLYSSYFLILGEQFLSILKEFLLFKYIFKVLSLLEACFDLMLSPSPSMKIQIMGRKITENSNPCSGRSIFLSLEHNIRYILPEIFSHFLLFGQVNQRNYDVVDIYQSKLFEQKLFVEVLRIIESIIQRQKCDHACKWKSYHKCYLEFIK